MNQGCQANFENFSRTIKSNSDLLNKGSENASKMAFYGQNLANFSGHFCLFWGYFWTNSVLKAEFGQFWPILGHFRTILAKIFKFGHSDRLKISRTFMSNSDNFSKIVRGFGHLATLE